MIYTNRERAQKVLNQYYNENLILLLSGQTNKLIPKEIKCYTIVENDNTTFAFGIISLQEVDFIGIQNVPNGYIMKLSNDTISVYISYISNGLLPSITQVQLIDNTSKSCVT